MRWLPASVLGGSEAASLTTIPAASTNKSVLNGPDHAGPSQQHLTGSATTSSALRPASQVCVMVPKTPRAVDNRAPRPREPTSSSSTGGWARDLAAALNRSFARPSVKGKERARSPPQDGYSESESSVEAEPAQEDLLSSPVVPHPPLPEDSFEDSIWVDEDDDPPRPVSSLTRRKARQLPVGGSRSSAWLRRLDDEDVFENHTAYYVGQKPKRVKRITPPPQVRRQSKLSGNMSHLHLTHSMLRHLVQC